MSSTGDPVIIVDGIYSGRLELSDLVDMAVLVDAPADVRRQRHDSREGADELGWHRLWDPVEEYHFTMVRRPDSFDLIV